MIISVIVPIYNAEGTLLRCLDSLKAQTFRDFEVLMIDDGSPDCCGKMIDDYAQKDSRFKAFHKQNGGVSSARQFGIDHAQGLYTIHADPDDWVEPTMLEDLYLKAQEENADMVICDFYVNTYKGQKYVKQQPSALDHLTVQKELFQQLHGSCCNKLVKRACYSEGNVRFPEGISNCEDQYVITAILNNDIRVSYLSKAFYHYVRCDTNSLSRAYSEQTHAQDILLRSLFHELLKGTSLDEYVFPQKTYIIFASSFWGGKKWFTSKTFKEEFSSYESVVREMAPSPIIKHFMILACRGYYQLSIGVLDILMKCKHFILKSKAELRSAVIDEKPQFHKIIIFIN